MKNTVSLGTATFVTQISIVILSLVCNVMLFRYGELSKYGPDIPISVFSIQTKVYTVVLNIVTGIVLGGHGVLFSRALRKESPGENDWISTLFAIKQYKKYNLHGDLQRYNKGTGNDFMGDIGAKRPYRRRRKVMYNIVDFGAIADGATNSAPFVQKAIDACKANGGGVVYFPAGTYVMGSVHLYSNIHIVFEPGAKVLGSTNTKDFDPREKIEFKRYQDGSHSYIQHSMFWAQDCENISVTGLGTIDMQEIWETEHTPGESEWGGKRAAKIIAFKRCRNVMVTDLTLLRATDVAVYFAGCEKVRVSKLNLEVNIDGISPDCCKDVIISDCMVKSGDDAIVLKSSYILNEKKVCENITVTNCIVSSRCNGIKLGTESNGGFKNIVISNCTVYNTFSSGIALQITDGGDMDGVSVSNISMKNVGSPVFIILSDRRRGPEGTKLGSLKNVAISNVTATGPYTQWYAPRFSAVQEKGEYCYSDIRTSTVTGQPGTPIENISLENIRMVVPGGGTKEERDVVVPEITNLYPENRFFGDKNPAYGIYFRHVKNLSVRNVHIDALEKDEREPFYFEDVEGLKHSASD